VPELLEIHRQDAPIHAKEVGGGRIDEVHVHHPVGVWKREAAQHHGIDHAELRGDRGDPERQHEDGERAKRTLFDKDANANAHVLEDGFKLHRRRGSDQQPWSAGGCTQP
jgi:hypothetical protein